jgi:poly-beta-1,6-N-acetyl-D-glucosamine biosynthesis protein PgaD
VGKSGSRVANPEIIDSWHLKSRTRILLESFLTLAFWSGFLYLLTPVVTLILWVLGVRIAYTELMGSQGLIELIKIIKGGCFAIFIVAMCIIAWGYYNYLLFRIRGERRSSQVRICFDEDFSARFHIDLQTLQAAKEQSYLSVTLTDSGMVVKPAPGPPSSSLTKASRRQRIKSKQWRSPAGHSHARKISKLIKS